jgi:hypothetical protein
MISALAAARNTAERLRFSGDVLRGSSEGNENLVGELRASLLETALRACEEVTPGLASVLNEVRTRLDIPNGKVDLFVYASPEIQATCFASTRTSCVIKVSSALVEILEREELKFVIGHELGHFLLGHGFTDSESDAQSADQLIFGRAQEISADRIGLWACQDLDASIRGLMKIISGLGSSHLRFDVRAFTSQIQGADSSKSNATAFSTHPSILVRCRALLWSSMLEDLMVGTHAVSVEDLRGVDEHISSDLARFVDGPLRDQVACAEREVAMWDMARDMTRDGILNNIEQVEFGRIFGEDVLGSLKALLAGTPVSEVGVFLTEKFQSSLAELAAISPRAHASWLSDKFKG